MIQVKLHLLEHNCTAADLYCDKFYLLVNLCTDLNQRSTMTNKTLKTINWILGIIYIIFLILYVTGVKWAEKPTFIVLVLGLLWCQFRDSQYRKK